MRRMKSQPDRNGHSFSVGTNLHVDLGELALLQIGELLRFSVFIDLGSVGDNEKETLFVALEGERSRRCVYRLDCPMKHKNLVCSAHCVRSSAEAQTEKAKQQNNRKSSYWPWDR